MKTKVLMKIFGYKAHEVKKGGEGNDVHVKGH
jgi:hypothetical protein